MAHIKLTEGLPGIRGLFSFRPERAKPLCELGDVLLHQPNSLSAADRELIATYVSSQNDCFYCQTSHGAIAAYHLGGDEKHSSRGKEEPRYGCYFRQAQGVAHHRRQSAEGRQARAA
jgi:AhpD family alkylhydroperoxidase